MKLMRNVGINTDTIEECVSKSTEAKLMDQRQHPAWSPRALRINGWRYTGMLDPDLVTRAICSGFITVPPECNQLVLPRNPYDPIQAAGILPARAGVTFGQMFSWMGITLLVAFE